MISGKTTRILNRFPDFYVSENPLDLLHQWMEIMGVMLDQTEADLAKVLRSRFVDTAENTISQDFLGAQKGDLDQIFTLYLEQLGGTSQLARVSQIFQPSDLKQVSDLVRQLVSGETALAAYLWNRFSPSTQHLLSRYVVVNARFPDEFLLPLPTLLGLTQDAKVLELYQRSTLSAETKQRIIEHSRFQGLLNAAFHSSPKLLSPALIRHAIALTQQREQLQKLLEQTLASLAVKLISGRDLFTSYCFSQLSPATQEQLNQFDGAVPVPVALKRSLAQDFNQLLRNRSLFEKFQDYTSQIRLAQLLQTLNHGSLQPRHVTFAQKLRKRLTLPAQKFLFALSDTDPIPTEIPVILQQELTVLLSDLYFISSLLEPTETEGLQLSERAIALLLQLALDVITTLLLGVTSDRPAVFLRPIPPPESLLQNPVGEDLERLNRLLLEAVYPAMILPSGIPAEAQVREALRNALNDTLTDPQLYSENRTSFLALTLATEAEALIAQTELKPNELPRLNRLLLEATFPTQLERRDSPYRDRLLRLITVLKSGASTKEGIVNIVAANLGISITDPHEIRPWEEFLFDLPSESETSLSSLTASPGLRQAFSDRGTLLSYSATVAMDQPQRRWTITDINTAQVYVVRKQMNRFSVHRQFIRVIEFLPQAESHQYTVHPQPISFTEDVAFAYPFAFSITNPNPLPTVPAIEVKLRDRRPTSEQVTRLSPLTNVRLVNQSGQFVQYTNTLNCNDVLLFLPDGTILVNGKVWRTFTVEGNVLINGQSVDSATPELVSRIPPLSLHQSQWHIEAAVGYARATFEQTLFDSSKFDQISLDPINPLLASSYVFEVNFSFYKLTPGSFWVRIPWDIPGYTDQFDEADHPRNQIHPLIDRVRAAGVRSVIVYEKRFTEFHDMEVRLSLVRSPFEEDHEMEEDNFDIRSQQKPYANGVEHEMTDTLITSIAFDYSRFDSMNTFG